MSARARLARVASIALVTLLFTGSALVLGPSAFAVADEATEAVQTNEIIELEPAEEGVGAPDAVSAPEVVAEAELPATDEADLGDIAVADETDSGDSLPSTDDSGDLPTETPVAQAPVETAEDPAEDAEEAIAVDVPVAKTAKQPLAKESVEPAIAEPKAGDADASDAATLEWGVKASFRNYIYNMKSFEGTSALLGTTDQFPEDTGNFIWAEGTGFANESGTLANVKFGEGNGVHFQSHPMTFNGTKAYSLDMQFTNPRIIVSSVTTGELYVDAVGRDFIDMTSVGPEYKFENVLMADLELEAPVIANGRVTWTNAEATLADSGVAAFGAFYGVGEELDPVTFSAPIGEVEVGPTPESPEASAKLTTTTVKASTTSTTEGGTVKLTANISPKAATGAVQFMDNGAKLGKAVTVKNGAATLSTKKLTVGDHAITANFVPGNSTKFKASKSKATTVTIEVDAQVAGASLTWGVKGSFRNYIYNFKAFEGKTALLGSAEQPTAEGVFVWSDGVGSAANDGTEADVSFGAGNGVHFQSHPMAGGHALDLKFTNPRVVVTSATTGELRLDVEGREFISTTEMGDAYTLKDTKVATLTLPAPTAKGNTLSWKNAAAVLTADGSAAFGDFYAKGEALDPVSFSLPLSTAVTTKKATSTQLKASAGTIASGGSVTLTASVAPNVSGAVTFSAGGKSLGSPVTVANGKAKTTIKPAAGTQSVIASFVPASSKYGHSVSEAVTIKVEKKEKQRPDAAAPNTNGAQGAGSLTWGVSSAFADYVTGPIAKGEVTTSGVGSAGGAYLFPQVSGGSWDAKTQTGSVQYSGTVTYTGHKGLLSEGVSNPMITVTGPTTAVLSSGGAQWATLDLGGANKSVGAGGEVTWSGVAVNGGFSGGSGAGSSYTLPADALSFTVGAVSGASFGSTAVSNESKKRTVADAAPSTTGINILTNPKKITAGAEIEFEARGFEAGERDMIVALYPGVTVLDEAAGADDQGTVRWIGILPEDIKPGEYIISLQGSGDAGAEFIVRDAKKVKKDKKEAEEAEVQAKLAQGVDPASVSSAGVAPAGTGPVWLWWAGAGALIAIAGAMGGLVAMQRRNAAK
ncbi:peroxiredoxin [Leucobacter exalbidus]|uniref:Peroxiredoxin n=1 Tax=Leucobacter exalbidus TaxID=662960 RepID=A0A940T1Q4_9MICO|nr:HtaA domain-containing protein [Leucobacter exalbidus]MBP1327090.1 peroxiredoxin [Leucobacter exalbidus]